MANFFPVYSRTSDALNQKRLSSTLQQNQVKLNQLQQQIATGNRIGAPSEDPIAALRAVRYQASLERAGQYSRNLQANKGYLNASDSAIRSTSDLITQVKGSLTGWADSTLNDAQRQAAIAELSGVRDQLIGLSNTKYNGRYLFAGTDTSILPYSFVDGHVQFHGNDGQIQAPTATDELLQSNISGHQVFGGFSTQIEGTQNLQPILTSKTKLADLRSGNGISSGSIEVSDGYSTSTVDLSTADTVGDVVRLIEAAPPSGRQVSVEIKNDHLEVRFTDDPNSQISIRESNGGTTATDLGLRSGQATSNGGLIVGQSLAPRLALSTRLEETVGSPSIAYLTSPGEGNDIVFRAKSNGEAFDGLQIQYVNSENLQAGPGVIQGSEEVFYETSPRAAQAGLSFSGTGNDILLTSPSGGSHLNNVNIQVYDAGAIGNNAVVGYDASTQTYSIGIDSASSTTADAIVNAINAEGTFTATGDTSDPANGSYNPTSTISIADAGVVNSNTGNSGGEANTVYIHVNPDKTNAKHVLHALGKNTALNDDFDIYLDETDGIAVTAPSKNIIDANATTVTSGGSGADFDNGAGIEFRVDSQRYRVDLDDVETVEDLINTIKNTVPGSFAQINADGSGLRVGMTQSGVSFSIGENGGLAASQLGLRTLNADTLLSSLNDGNGVGTQNGIDFTIHRNDGVSIDIDVSTAKTVQDVLDLINDHPDNQDPDTWVRASLSQYGNAISILDDNPTGSLPVSIELRSGSNAGVDLGLVPIGASISYPTNSPTPTQAYANILYSGPTGVERSFAVTANEPGYQYNNVEIEYVAGVSGDNAIATFDSLNQKLVVQVDPASTRTNTVVDAINLSGYFRAELINNDYEAYNSGSAVVSTLGVIGTLGGGSAEPSGKPAKAILRPAAPNQYNTAIDIEASQPGTAFNFSRIEFQSGGVGDTAVASYDSVNRKLIVTIDPNATTSNTIVAAINSEGTYNAQLNTTVDPTNDGTGVYSDTGIVGTALHGTPDVLKGRDVSMQQNHSIFNTIDRLINALQNDSEEGRVAFTQAASMLELDIERIDEAISNIGTRGQYNDILIFQNEDLTLDLQESLSEELDVDLVEAISQLTAQQATVEASMKMLSQTFNVSLLDYI